jgi:uncharacterized protein involved in exopolysaccharide biosynthesis
MENSRFDEEFDKDFDFKEFIDKYAKQWRWFVVGVVICVSCAFIYIRYTVPQYNVETTILVKDEKKGGMLSELSAFADMGLGGGMKSNLDNEIEILKSRTLVESTVRKLGLNTSFILEGRVIERQIYKYSPIRINFFEKKNRFYENSITFEVKFLTSNSFKIEESIIVGDASIDDDLKLC